MNDIFSYLYPKYIIDKPIRLIELFGGYGSQHFALEYLGANFEHYKLVEWAVKSIQAYKDAHYSNDDFDYSKIFTKDEITNYLYNKHISMDYNKPMTLKQIKSKNEQWLRQVYNNIQATKNIVDITNTKAADLEIVDTNKYTYIMTYSFPCQDLSLAGLGKGMARDSGTRSGMLWEVERILDECVELPQVLLMENVPEVKGSNNVRYFNEWQSKLESLGYKNYHQNLIATDYGIPQTRNRCFMVSILGDYSYTFPNPMPLKLKLKDLLEDDVDEKYFLSKKMLNGMLNTTFESYKLENKLLDNEGNANTILARFDGSPQVVGTYQYSKSENFMKGKDRFQENKEVSDTLQTTPKEGIVVKEATKKGYAIAVDGDTINLEQPNSKTRRGRVGKGVAQTLMTNPQQATIDNLRIRKLTPKECFRLMGVKDEDFEKIAKNQSDSSLYHLAGDSIVINVLMAIFKEML